MTYCKTKVNTHKYHIYCKGEEGDEINIFQIWNLTTDFHSTTIALIENQLQSGKVVLNMWYMGSGGNKEKLVLTESTRVLPDILGIGFWVCEK